MQGGRQHLLLGQTPVAAAQGAAQRGTRVEMAETLKTHPAAGVLAGIVLLPIAAHAAGWLPNHAAQAAQGQAAQRGRPQAAQLTGQLRLHTWQAELPCRAGAFSSTEANIEA